MRDLLLENGYKQFTPNPLHPNAFRAYQKCVRGESGKLYFITVYEYHAHHEELFNRFEAEGQFNTVHGITFDVLMHHGFTFTQLEIFFGKIYADMGCVPYDG